MEVYVEGIGVAGPGLAGWPRTRAVLAGDEPYVPAPTLLPPPANLPPAERRRVVPSVKLALAVGNEAVAHAGAPTAEMPAVFASSGGDGETINHILEVLATQEREVSPTRFHNSVHNAPAGYWSIATGSREPTTSLAGYDGSFCAGLIEAGVEALAGACRVVAIAYDLPYPEPLHQARPIAAAFGAAFVLSATPGPRSLAKLSLRLDRETCAATALPDPMLEALRTGTPAARSLPLLAALAAARSQTVVLAHVAGNRLLVGVEPR